MWDGLGVSNPAYQGQRPTFGREPMHSQTVPHFGPSAGGNLPPGTPQYGNPNPAYAAPANPAYAAPAYAAPANPASPTYPHPAYAAPAPSQPGYPAVGPSGVNRQGIPSQAPYAVGGAYSQGTQQPVTANYGSAGRGAPAPTQAAPWQYPQRAPSVSSNFQQASPLTSSQPQL